MSVKCSQVVFLQKYLINVIRIVEIIFLGWYMVTQHNETIIQYTWRLTWILLLIILLLVHLCQFIYALSF